jgi:hypothetical protein
MTDGGDGDREREGDAYIDGIEPDEVATDDQLRPTPEQHERLKAGLHGDRFAELKRSERRYLVVGRGDDGPGRRRRRACEQLDDRAGAIAVRLEEFGFTGEEVELWASAFDVLSAMATHIVGILEDYDGGHVWELGFLYHHQSHVRDVLWLLKRRYSSEAEMRDRYDNGMAASHLAALEEAAGERVITWTAPADLPDAIESIP